MQAAIGIDFGTSNTAAAIQAEGTARVLPLEPGRDTMPTAIFLDRASRQMLIGSAAVSAMIEGREGRFMRALKSILGTPLARETRTFMGRRMTLLDLIAEFLAEVRARAEAAAGMPPGLVTVGRVTVGRPVHFHSADPRRDAQAAADLAECCRLAGLGEVRFLAEPEAAALAAGPCEGAGLGLVIDIGGGTSDFTLFDSRGGDIAIRASHGVRIGGTDVDRALSLGRVMPLLGLGGELRNDLGDGRHDVPQALYHELASWEKIAFLYSPQALSAAKAMARRAVEPERLGRLVKVIEEELGHDIAFAVEAAKIGANDRGSAQIALDMIAPRFGPVLDDGDLTTLIWPLVARIDAAIAATLESAGTEAAEVRRLIFVGGSSRLGLIERAAMARFPGAAIERSDVFTAVVRGLALASGRD